MLWNSRVSLAVTFPQVIFVTYVGGKYDLKSQHRPLGSKVKKEYLAYFDREVADQDKVWVMGT